MIIGPVSLQGLMHPDGELATAAAARALGVTYTMSNSASRTIEAVAGANGDGHRWYQLYRRAPPLSPRSRTDGSTTTGRSTTRSR